MKLGRFRTSFIDDEEKMFDFLFLSKEEFLASYSYLTEEEYILTANEVLKRCTHTETQFKKNLLTWYENRGFSRDYIMHKMCISRSTYYRLKNA